MQTSLEGINNRARKDARHRFGGLYRLLNVENLRWAFYQLNKSAAPGVDGVTQEQYLLDLEGNLQRLNARLKNKSYKAKLIRRHYIPKNSGKMRPLGIPALEDKIVQLAAAKILESIYEADFISTSYGYRPGRGAQGAVEKTSQLAMFGRCNYVVEADIKGFFDNIDHDCLLRMIGQRVNDKAFIGLVHKWLKAGVLEDGKVMSPESGTPQGGVISPVLANIYLHYVLDIWFDRQVRRRCRGNVAIVRYADDFVCFFENIEEAQAFYAQLPGRLRKFNLEVAPEKTQILSFSRLWHPKGNGSFVFLGFEFRWKISRKGKPHVWRRTAPKKMCAAIKDFTEWVKRNRRMPLKELMSRVRSKLCGHYNYFGLPGNSKGLSSYFYWCKRSLLKWLNRRSQKRSYEWSGFAKMLKHYRIHTPTLNRISQSRKRKQQPTGQWKLVPLRK